ncbi:MAG: leucyl/phenylalanyl-tRNA--protein transferase [Acidimicrobiia bacterium]|nr:leucyl/phenylalanyl-tRNA--protein transferase [Acidimicrobiia bacterium]
MPVEPPPSPWELPDPADADDRGVVGVGADLEPGTLLDAYRHGIFPMRLGTGGPLGWWSPDPRGVIPLDGLRVSRSLRRSTRRFTTSVDRAFDQVIRGCADPTAREGGWIDDSFIDAYSELHRLGWVHSVETWDRRGALVGGLYGVAIGGFFAGESMFHTATDASKVALVALVDHLRARGAVLLDVQWCTDHLTSLGAVEISRSVYLGRLRRALTLPDSFET